QLMCVLLHLQLLSGLHSKTLLILFNRGFPVKCFELVHQSLVLGDATLFLSYLVVDVRAVFFFQAEDGIRDFHVTGVQTCALPILLVLGGFMIVNWLAANAAHDLLNPSRQYGGLFALAAAQALIFAPFLHLFFEVLDDGATTVVAAGAVTALGFAGLTAVAFTTRRDLSFLRPLVLWGFVSALVLIVSAVLFGWEPGVWFSVAMITLAGGSIL